ncbi:hypothetical protein [Pseudomonas syringae group genomosp. 3]|uniref:hypothetical protein n=1 Tax=Pseudomonas syringae group genomosp. 3 TaxID=251701 RepID=UPI0001E28587|nr:hypothetical protein [Pseudomonas syringae group genomosp. 3]
MSDVNVMLCTIHDLRFEQPNSWYDKGLGEAGCLMCMAERLKATRDDLDKAIAHRKVLLQAIDLKLTLQTVEADWS